MQIVLNPKYHQLHDELLQVARNFESSGKEIYHGRNVIRLVEIDGLRLAVKRYGRMPLKHRVATRFYKTNKAKRAFFTSLMLKERSFESPEAVAFLCDRHGVLDATHLLCEHLFGLPPTQCATSPRSTGLPRRGDEEFRPFRRTTPQQWFFA